MQNNYPLRVGERFKQLTTGERCCYQNLFATQFKFNKRVPAVVKDEERIMGYRIELKVKNKDTVSVTVSFWYGYNGRSDEKRC